MSYMTARKRDSELTQGKGVPRAGGESWLRPGTLITKTSYSNVNITMGALGTATGTHLVPGMWALVVAACQRITTDPWERDPDMMDAVVVVGQTAYRAWVEPCDVDVIRRPE